MNWKKIIKGIGFVFLSILKIVGKIFRGLFRELGRWDKKRVERLKYEEAITKQSYLKEKGRIQAKEDMKEQRKREKLGWEIMTGQRPSPLQESFFGSYPKKRKKRK